MAFTQDVLKQESLFAPVVNLPIGEKGTKTEVAPFDVSWKPGSQLTGIVYKDKSYDVFIAISHSIGSHGKK